MVAIAYHCNLREVQGDPEVAALLDSPAQAAPFDRLAWWQGLADTCGMDALMAVARNGSGVAVLPLRHEGRSLEALANWYSFRVRPVLSPGADACGLIGELASDLARRTAAIRLAPVPDEDGSATMIAAAFRAAGWSVASEACDVNHILRPAGRSFTEYLAGRPGPLRTTLRRKSSKSEIAIYQSFNADAWDEYETIYEQSWKPREGSPAFLRSFAEAEGAAGRLRLGIARVGGNAVAAQFWTVEGGTAYIHKLAHLKAARHLSPGTTLTAAMLEQAIDRDRVELVDFGTGDDPYKRDWMEEVRPRYRLEMLRPGAPANWPRFARRTARRLVHAARRG
ncbi:MAG: GNAT family N-acetyltransferase [Novosphingobium sp.]|nr:GNAT family N-acetyltransferase [Novosphingobium sp.]